MLGQQSRNVKACAPAEIPHVDAAEELSASV